MAMPGRSFSATTQYRYGFNGKENDRDINDGAQDYGMRINDTRLGRFLSVDPLSATYPWYTPYQFAGNNPIVFIDLDGQEPYKPGTGSYSDYSSGDYSNSVGPIDTKHDWWDKKNKYDPVTRYSIRIAEAPFIIFGMLTQVAAATHYGDKVPKDKWAEQFPLIPNNNIAKDMILPMFTTPVTVLARLATDPSDAEAWADATVLIVGYKGILGKGQKGVAPDISLGINNYSKMERYSLPKFADKFKALDQERWGQIYPDFVAASAETGFLTLFNKVVGYTVDNGGRIKFDMTYFDWDIAKEQFGKNPYSPEGGLTSWEMEQIMANKKILKNVDFMKNGKRNTTKNVVKKYKEVTNQQHH